MSKVACAFNGMRRYALIDGVHGESGGRFGTVAGRLRLASRDGGRLSSLIEGMKLDRKITLLLAIALSATAADANTIRTGTLARVALSPNGLVQVNYGYGTHYLCRLSKAYGGFTPDTCKATYAMLLSAYHAGSPVSFYFNASLNACTDLPNWAPLDPAPYHVAMLE